MTLCPIALAIGCKQCPIFSICPVKTIIGDYKPPTGGAANSPNDRPQGK